MVHAEEIIVLDPGKVVLEGIGRLLVSRFLTLFFSHNSHIFTNFSHVTLFSAGSRC
jgi:hypothetical protein